MIIYLIWNRINGKGYVGQTIRTLEERWREHCRSGNDTYIDRAIRKAGAGSFEYYILAETHTLGQLNKLEEYYIKDQNTLSPHGYNLHTGGLNHRVSDKTRAKMIASFTPERRVEISILRKHTKASPETRAKMSVAHKGRRHSLIWIARAAANWVGRKHSAKSKAKMSKAKKGKAPWNTGKSHPAKTRENKRAITAKDCKREASTTS